MAMCVCLLLDLTDPAVDGRLPRLSAGYDNASRSGEGAGGAFSDAGRGSGIPRPRRSFRSPFESKGGAGGSSTRAARPVPPASGHAEGASARYYKLLGGGGGGDDTMGTDRAGDSTGQPRSRSRSRRHSQTRSRSREAEQGGFGGRHRIVVTPVEVER